MHLSAIKCVEVFAKQLESIMMTKRELIDTGNDKRYVRRDDEDKFKKSVDVSRSLSADARREAKADAKPGQGDRGDRKRRP
jgi:hypothetical protein